MDILPQEKGDSLIDTAEPCGTSLGILLLFPNPAIAVIIVTIMAIIIFILLLTFCVLIKTPPYIIVIEIVP